MAEFSQIKKNKSSLILAAILVWPTFIFLPSNLTKQVTLLLLILCALFWVNKMKFKFGFVELLLLLNFSYTLLNTIFHYTSYRDFGDSIKSFGVLIFFILGKNCYFYLKQKHFLWINYLLLFLILFFFLYKIGILPVDLSSYLYSDFGRRFFGFSNSPNYLWINLFVLAFFSLINRESIPNFKLYLLIYLFALIITGSRTSVILLIVSSLILFLYKINFKKILTAIFILLLLQQFIFYLFSDSFFINRITNLFNALISFDLSLIPSFNFRLGIWEDIISKFSIFGNGPEKSSVSIFDNTYITTIIRFGYFGLFLELLPIIYLIFKRSDDRVKIYKLVLIISFLIAGIPSSIFYNLKAPYLFYFVMGTMIKNKYD